MNACFNDLVSMREYCEGVTPKSGIYLNDFGLTKEQVEAILTGDYASAKDLINSTLAMSLREITTEIYGHFSSDIKTHSAIETGVVGVVSDNNAIMPGGNWIGVYLKLQNGANYLNFQLPSFGLKLDHNGSVDVLVYDLDQNKLLDTIPVVVVAGEITRVYPLKVYQSGMRNLNLWIGYDGTAIDSYKVTTRAGVCCGNYSRTTTYLKAQGTTISGDFIQNNLDNIQHTGGILLEYSIWCDQFSWLCSYANMLALPIAFKTVAEIYRRGALVSPTSRSNNSTNTNADLMNRNWGFHEEKYRESLSNILKRIHLPKNTACFICNTPVTHKIILP